jgi:hypothetical protein
MCACRGELLSHLHRTKGRDANSIELIILSTAREYRQTDVRDTHWFMRIQDLIRSHLVQALVASRTIKHYCIPEETRPLCL